MPDEPAADTFLPADARRAGAHIRHYTVQVASPAVLRIIMVSTEVEPFLYLFDAGGQVVAQAFDRRPGAVPSVAELTYPAGPGCYVVGASTWRAGTTGSYVLTLTLEQP